VILESAEENLTIGMRTGANCEQSCLQKLQGCLLEQGNFFANKKLPYNIFNFNCYFCLENSPIKSLCSPQADLEGIVTVYRYSI
jgi:hypothetical protein